MWREVLEFQNNTEIQSNTETEMLSFWRNSLAVSDENLIKMTFSFHWSKLSHITKARDNPIDFFT